MRTFLYAGFFDPAEGVGGRGGPGVGVLEKYNTSPFGKKPQGGNAERVAFVIW